MLCLFLHPKLLLSLPNAAASQTARDSVAVSRTEFHGLLFVNALEKPVQIHSQTAHELMTRMVLVHKNLKVTFYARTLLTELYINIIHNRKSMIFLIFLKEYMRLAKKENKRKFCT